MSIPSAPHLQPLRIEIQENLIHWRAWDMAKFQSSTLGADDIEDLIGILTQAGQAKNDARMELISAVKRSSVLASVDGKACSIKNSLNKMRKIGKALSDGRSSLMEMGVYVRDVSAECAAICKRVLANHKFFGQPEDATWSFPCHNISRAMSWRHSGLDFGDGHANLWLVDESEPFKRLGEADVIWSYPVPSNRKRPWTIHVRPALSSGLNSNEIARAGADLVDGLDAWAKSRFDWIVPELDSCLDLFEVDIHGAEVLRVHGLRAVAPGLGLIPSESSGCSSVRDWMGKAKPSYLSALVSACRQWEINCDEFNPVPDFDRAISMWPKFHFKVHKNKEFPRKFAAAWRSNALVHSGFIS